MLLWHGVPALSIFLVWPICAAVAGETRERMLEARVQVLERQLQRLEARLDERGLTPPKHRAAAATRPFPASPAVAPAQAPGHVYQPTQTAAQLVRDPAESLPARPALGVGKATDAPQEAFVFRQNAVTLSPWRFEADTNLGYIHSNGFLQTDRAAVATTSLRVGVLDWLELNAMIPAFITSRSRGVGPFRNKTNWVNGLGDISIHANARIHEQTADTPGAVLSLGMLLPTGANPYDFAHYQPDQTVLGYNPNPTNLNAAYLSRGSWGIQTHLELYKTIDPVILFFGVGASYLFPQKVSGYSVQAGFTYDYNMGLSLALSDKSSLGLQVEGAYQTSLTVNRRAVPQSELEPVAIRVSLIQRLLENTWIEPSLAAGLTNNTPGLALGIGFRHRF